MCICIDFYFKITYYDIDIAKNGERVEHMKRINDTYTSFSESKFFISDSTEIDVKSSVANEKLAELAQKNGDGDIIKRIYVTPINNAVLKKAKEMLGKVEEPVADSFFVEISNGEIRIYTDTKNGVLYGACAVCAHYKNGINGGLIYNVPLVPFRAVKVYTPAENNIGFFKEFIDMCMFYGYNTLVMEVGGAMEYKKHPEINEGWVEYCDIFREYNKKSNETIRCAPWNKNSIHWENGGGSFLPQSTVKELVAFCNERGIEVIPEVPSLSHCDYLLTRHPELAENKADIIPDTYCPSNPKSYELVFDVLDEVAEVFNPKTVHIAHDEWYSACMCEKCASKNAGELYAEDINKIYDYLAEKGIECMVWGDGLFAWKELFGGTGVIRTRKIPTEKTVNIKGKELTFHREYWGKSVDESEGGFVFLGPDSSDSMELVPKKLKVMNWYYAKSPNTDNAFLDNGFWNVYGNFHPRAFENWYPRIEKGVHGFSISNWSMLDYRHMQRNAVLFSVAYGSMMAWNRDFDENKREENTLAASHDLYEYHYANAMSGAYAEIVHGTDFVIPHDLFVDGYCMDEAADKIGHYKIEYEDGTEDIYNIFYGLNIGYVIPDWFDQKNDLSGEETGVLEPTYTCDYHMIGSRAYYKLLIPLAKNAKRIVPVFMDKYADSVHVESITINNNER